MEDIVYNASSGKLVRFVDLDKTRNQILDLQNGIGKQGEGLS